MNLLVHREYSFRASTFISLYADRLEFTSIGGLVSGVSLNDITMGISVCRNTKLANVFYRLELIEAYGTGIIKIMEAYEGTGMTPQIEASDNAFKIILPNLNAMPESARKMQGKPAVGTPEERVIALAKQRARTCIIVFLDESPYKYIMAAPDPEEGGINRKEENRHVFQKDKFCFGRKGSAAVCDG